MLIFCCIFFILCFSNALRTNLPLQESHQFYKPLNIPSLTQELRHEASLKRAKLRSFSSTTTPRSLKDKSDDLRSYLEGLSACLKLPGLAVGIIVNGTVVFNEGYGLRDADNKLNVDLDTLWPIGSASKAFTAALSAKQMQWNMYNWDTKVSDVLPGFHLNDPVADATVTIRDLLAHRTGLPRHDTALFTYTDRTKIAYNAKFLPPSTPLRNLWQYNNWMIVVAGYLQGVLNGTTWEELVKEEIFLPLNMTNTFPNFKDVQSSDDKAIPAYWNGANYVSASWEENLMIDPSAPAGAIQSTTTDMLKWAQFHIDTFDKNKEPLLSKTLLEEMHTASFLMPSPFSGYWPSSIDPNYMDFCFGDKYGMGWFTTNYRGYRRVMHGGNVVGAAAMVNFYPDQGLGMVMFTNEASYSGGPWRDVISSYAADLYLDLDPLLDLTSSCTFPCSMYPDMCAQYSNSPIPENNSPIPENNNNNLLNKASGLEDYLGTFTNPGYGALYVTLTADNLALNITYGLDTFPAIRPENIPNGDYFLASDNVTSMSFWRTTPSGAVVAGTLHYEQDANYSITFTNSKYDQKKDSPSCGYLSDTQISYAPSNLPGPTGQSGSQGEKGEIASSQLVVLGVVVSLITLVLATLISIGVSYYWNKKGDPDYFNLPGTVRDT